MADPVVTVTPAATGAPPPAADPAATTPSSTAAATTVTPAAATPAPVATPAPAATEKAPGVPAKSALEAGTEEAKSVDAAPVVVVVPEEYKSIKPPEGMDLDTPTWKAVAPIFAKAGVKPEQAQEIINEFAKAESARVAADAKAYTDAQTTARAECAKLFKAEDYTAAKRAIGNTFKDPSLVQFMTSQLGNHPDFIAGMAKVGRALADDGTPGTQQSGSVPTPDPAQNFAKQAGW